MNYLFKIGNQSFELVSYKNMVAVGVCDLLPPVLKITCDIHEVDKSTWNGMGRKLTTDELKKWMATKIRAMTWSIAKAERDREEQDNERKSTKSRSKKSKHLG